VVIEDIVVRGELLVAFIIFTSSLLRAQARLERP